MCRAGLVGNVKKVLWFVNKKTRQLLRCRQLSAAIVADVDNETVAYSNLSHQFMKVAIAKDVLKRRAADVGYIIRKYLIG